MVGPFASMDKKKKLIEVFGASSSVEQLANLLRKHRKLFFDLKDGPYGVDRRVSNNRFAFRSDVREASAEISEVCTKLVALMMRKDYLNCREALWDYLDKYPPDWAEWLANEAGDGFREYHEPVGAEFIRQVREILQGSVVKVECEGESE